MTVFLVGSFDDLFIITYLHPPIKSYLNITSEINPSHRPKFYKHLFLIKKMGEDKIVMKQ